MINPKLDAGTKGRVRIKYEVSIDQRWVSEESAKINKIGVNKSAMGKP